MFNELPGFFDRNFIVAFFLPSLVFVLAGFGLMSGFDVNPKLTAVISEDLYKGATIIGVTSLIISVFLLSLNYSIFRFFEGYGKYNPLKLLRPLHTRKFFKIEEEKNQLNRARREARLINDDEALGKIRAQRNELFQYAADRYPSKERAPTSDGVRQHGQSLRRLPGNDVRVGCDSFVGAAAGGHSGGFSGNDEFSPCRA
jgi:hypothetical protein